MIFLSATGPCTFGPGNVLTCNLGTIPAGGTATVTIDIEIVVTQVNQGLIYTVTVTNNGPSTATGVVLTDTLPANVRFVAATPTQGTCTLVGSTLTCLIGTLAPGETETATILVVPTAPGIITNTVTGNEFDPNLANNTASATVTVTQCLPGPIICQAEPGAGVTLSPCPIASNAELRGGLVSGRAHNRKDRQPGSSRCRSAVDLHA